MVEPRRRKEFPNEHIFKFVCFESAVCSPYTGARVQHGRWAVAVVKELPTRPVPSRIALHARPGPEVAGKELTRHRTLEAYCKIERNETDGQLLHLLIIPARARNVDVMRRLLSADFMNADRSFLSGRWPALPRKDNDTLKNKHELPTWRNSKTNTATESIFARLAYIRAKVNPPEAEYCRGQNKLPSMSHQAAPTSDNILLVYLVSVVLFMATAVWIVYQTTRSTVLPNAGVAAFERVKRVPVTLWPTSSLDAEQLAIEVALRENEEQGLTPLTVATQTDKNASPTFRTASTKTVRASNAAAVRPPKVKRVAKIRARATIPQGRDAWAYAPHGRAFAPFGGFEPWLR